MSIHNEPKGKSFHLLPATDSTGTVAKQTETCFELHKVAFVETWRREHILCQSFLIVYVVLKQELSATAFARALVMLLLSFD